MTRGVSKAQQAVAKYIPLLLDGKPLNCSVDNEPALNHLLSAVEYFASELLSEHCEDWSNEEGFDGVVPVTCSHLGDYEIEILGICILMSDQSETPIYVRLRPSARDRVVGILRVGEPDEETGRMVRYPCGSAASRRARDALRDRDRSVAWMYTVELGPDEARATTRTTNRCDECASLYFRQTSAMAGLCPECSYQLYGKEPCNHEFSEGRCRSCFWDGSLSDYLDRRPR